MSVVHGRLSGPHQGWSAFSNEGLAQQVSLKSMMMRILGSVRSICADARSVAVFAPESVGSVGDQAMVEVMRQQLVARRLNPTFVYMPNWKLIPTRHKTSTLTLKSSSNFSLGLWRTIARSNAMAVVGADVIDGNYSSWLPFQWIGKLLRAQEAGVRTGIVNFSFSTHADEPICQKLRSTNGLTFISRDPISHRRFVDATDQPATQSADLAFLLKPEVTSASARQAESWLISRKAAGETVLFVNLSGHTLSRMPGNGVATMSNALRKWLEEDKKRSILLVPHDFRPAPTGDVEALEQLRASLSDDFCDRVTMIHPPFAAWDVKALCAHADLATSGRMHLAIACLGMGVPVLSVVYAGKFEGLMQHIGLDKEDVLISPAQALDADLLLDKITKMTADRSRLSDVIKARLPAVRALSERNFDWL